LTTPPTIHANSGSEFEAVPRSLSPTGIRSARPYTTQGEPDFGYASGCTPRLCATFAILSGTPNSRRHTSASAATPWRISSAEGLAKHRRIRLLA
jgi:hypothetical protein